MTLPPGQRDIREFPRFGTHLYRPPPPVPVEPVIEVAGAVVSPVTVTMADLADLPRKELTADFHCVSGWSATDLQWEGVPFGTFYRTVIEPVLEPGATATHLVFEGLDHFRSVLVLEDALAPDVFIADRLDGRPLDVDHGAPVRLVSPSQYGFMSTKHLCRIEVHTTHPEDPYSRLPGQMRLGLRLVKPHARARVWYEERHRYVPAVVLRPIYRRLIGPIRRMSARGSRRTL